MNSKTLTETTNNWREQVEELQKLLASVQTELIDAETGLAERLAAISAFEFKLRALTIRFVERLEKLEAEISAIRKQLRHLDNGFYPVIVKKVLPDIAFSATGISCK